MGHRAARAPKAMPTQAATNCTLSSVTFCQNSRGRPRQKSSLLLGLIPKSSSSIEACLTSRGQVSGVFTHPQTSYPMPFLDFLERRSQCKPEAHRWLENPSCSGKFIEQSKTKPKLENAFRDLFLLYINIILI